MSVSLHWALQHAGLATHGVEVLDGLKDGYDVLGLGSSYEGGCPCSGPFAIGETIVDLHCWRTDTDHDGCGIHFEGDRSVAERLKPLLDAMDWYGEWTIVDEARSGE